MENRKNRRPLCDSLRCSLWWPPLRGHQEDRVQYSVYKSTSYKRFFYTENWKTTDDLCVILFDVLCGDPLSGDIRRTDRDPAWQPAIDSHSIILQDTRPLPEPVFLNVYGAQESIPRFRFRQPMLHGGPVRKIGLLYRPVRVGIDSWAPLKGLQIRALDTRPLPVCVHTTLRTPHLMEQ